MLLFPGGKVYHGGEPISSGVRYILTAFLFVGGVSHVPAALSALTMKDSIYNDAGDDDKEDVGVGVGVGRNLASCFTSARDSIRNDDANNNMGIKRKFGYLDEFNEDSSDILSPDVLISDFVTANTGSAEKKVMNNSSFSFSFDIFS